ncbi:sulfatase-like hydrolase/transferase [Algibacter mikhailovii]|uniref:N-acetylgalactosamine-6-sulfatase n=1 Tax=Algibacter mikhailovii TaxID=425498 RepID=A0A918R9Z3_9FLAO|nr:sulfatase-like hydrolase/transferase [Algibacter mikhailovii]GGZ87763.1 N-acetylgalactosamine-6-sulfatase [Algibacter mikhailovii]
MRIHPLFYALKIFVPTAFIAFFSIVVLLGFKSNIGLDVQERPNIIVVLTDDQGWADVGFNGATDIPTEHLDKLAEEGVIFSNGYVSHPYCSPSRAGLLTGRYQARFGHDCNMPYQGENDDTIGTPLSEKMISEALKKHGYTTSAIGKWHVGDHPNLHPTNQGFDHWFGFPGGGMNYWGMPNGPLRTVYRNGVEVPQNELSYLTDDFTDEAIGFIKKNEDRPFFIYLAYNAPHAPNHARKQYLENTKHIEYAGRSIYGAMVNAVDHGIGRIDSTLVAHDIKDNTVIVFLSDNGGRIEYADNRPNRGHKGMLFEGGIKVPFFMSWPDGLKGNQHYEQPVSSLDLYPTLLNIAGGQAASEKQLDGADLMPYLKGENKGKPHDLLFWRSSGGFEYAVRNEQYKLYKSAYKDKVLLFDLENDPLERHDIADENPDLIAALKAEYLKWDSKNIKPGWFDPHAENVIKEEAKVKSERNKSLSPTERD